MILRGESSSERWISESSTKEKKSRSEKSRISDLQGEGSRYFRSVAIRKQTKSSRVFSAESRNRQRPAQAAQRSMPFLTPSLIFLPPAWSILSRDGTKCGRFDTSGLRGGRSLTCAPFFSVHTCVYTCILFPHLWCDLGTIPLVTRDSIIISIQVAIESVPRWRLA